MKKLRVEQYKKNLVEPMKFANGGFVSPKKDDCKKVLLDRGWWKCKQCGSVFESYSGLPLNHICRKHSLLRNTDMRQASWGWVDMVIKRSDDLYDYNHAGRAQFKKFSRDMLAQVWFSTLGWRKFFVLDWWKFKFSR